MTQALVLAGAYLLGAIPFSFLVARWRGVDVRRVGSGNVGATNVMRSAGWAAGVLALLLDAVKGAAAAIVASRIDEAPALPALAAVAAVLGHVFPVWLRFQGGKGVATGLGAFLPLAPLAAGIGVAVFAAVVAATRYVSLASILGAVALAAAAFVTQPNLATACAAAFCAALIAVKHRGNIKRLRRGQERRLGARP
jgi:glycerol-3-phosphate acyltransferase PlsY